MEKTLQKFFCAACASHLGSQVAATVDGGLIAFCAENCAASMVLVRNSAVTKVTFWEQVDPATASDLINTIEVWSKAGRNPLSFPTH